MTRFLLLLSALCVAQLSAQFSYVADATPHEADGRTVHLNDLAELQKQLREAPGEFSATKSRVVISLPLPNGETAEFTAYDSPVIKGRPEFGSYLLRGPWGGGRIAVSERGIAGIAKGPNGYFLLDPIDQSAGLYRSVEYADLMRLLNASEGGLNCGYEEETMPDYAELAEAMEQHRQGGADAGAVLELKRGGEVKSLHVYDMVMTNTVEFANKSQVGGTAAGVQSAFNEAVTIINGIYEIELGVRINLLDVPGVIFTNNDPFNNPANGGGLLDQIIVAFTEGNIDPVTYDLGHIFTARCDQNLGGIVGGRACSGGKSRGVTCVSGSVAGAAIRIMAHEIAHQFAVSHTWNNCEGTISGNDVIVQRASATAFEPGSGTTIMSYAGACGDQNVGAEQSYYHTASLEQFLFYTREGGAADCATVVPTGNLTPEVILDYEDGFSIPISTPFKLEGIATDENPADRDRLTYVWEQFDLGPVADIRDPRGDAPLFRSFLPSRTGNVRYLPRLDRVVNNINSLSETLPTYGRNLTFRLTARDNNPDAGGTDWETVNFFAAEEAGPFTVENTTANWQEGDYREVRWNVAGTDRAPVNCRAVNILLSTNGGISFDETLAENVPNTGSAFVSVPEGLRTFDAMLMVEAADNIFFNVADNSFSILAATQPTFTLEANGRLQDICLPDVASFTFNSTAVAGFDTLIELSVEGDSLPMGSLVSLTEDQLMPGQATTLNVDLTDVRFTGRLPVTVVAISGNQDTARRTVFLDVVDTDYSDLATTTPVEGTTGVILSTDFSWTEALNADSYDIQIATAPTFTADVLFEEANNLNQAEYQPVNFFEANTLYFWRVRAANSCGPGEWLDPNSFRTVNTACRTVATEEDDILRLPGTGPGFERESVLFVEEQGTISDINIPNVDLLYNFASQVSLTLVSPAGTEVVLYRRNCFSTNAVNIGFDDDAPSNIPCPPDDRQVFLPEESLAAFNGEETFGEWILRIEVNSTGGSSGVLRGWGMEFCSDLQASTPERIINVPTEVRPNLSKRITGDNLRTTSAGFDSGEIVYTLTSLPSSGTLFRYQTRLMVGDTFRQADINGLGLSYENTNPEAETDDFSFVTTTADGGYLSVAYHDILITEDALVGNRVATPLAEGLEIFPNPATDFVGVRWQMAINRPVSIEVFDVNGRRLSNQTVDGAAKQASVSVADLPAGVYLLRVDGAVRRVVRN